MATLAPDHEHEQNLWHWFVGSRADRLLLLISLLAIFFAWQWIYAGIGSGPAMVMIYHDDTLLARYRLPEGGEPIHFHAEGELGSSEILIDKDGARFTSSPCTSQYCVSHGARSRHGDIIACVPNRILVSIEGSNSDSGNLDAIVE